MEQFYAEVWNSIVEIIPPKELNEELLLDTLCKVNKKHLVRIFRKQDGRQWAQMIDYLKTQLLLTYTGVI
jgi:hypothetical protein